MLSLEHLAKLVDRYPDAVKSPVKEFTIGERFFRFNSEPALMGVINLSPDSWYRESVCVTADQAIQRGKVLQAQGADLIDVGAESTLQAAARVGTVEQNSLLIPVIRALRDQGILVSAETYRMEVARACLAAGANVLNLTGTEQTDALFHLIADHDAAVILCYVQGTNVREVDEFDFGKDSTEMMRVFFARQIERAQKLGVDRILIDPGMGFYYRNLNDGVLRVRHQMSVFLNSFRLRTLGVPICHALPHAFETFGDEVRTAESFFAVLAALGKTNLFRTHEIPKVKAVLRTMQFFP